MEDDKKEKGFVIKDRRHFDESGSVRMEEESPQKEQTTPSGTVPESEHAAPTEEVQPHAHQEASVRTSREEAGRAPQEGPSQALTEEAPFPEINFANFIFSLSTTAMYHFGDFPDPVTGETRKNLPAAKQTIDILSILRTKTEGNLDEGEKELLDGVLFELRMRFVKEMKKQ